MTKTKKMAVNVYDYTTLTLNKVKTRYYNCPNKRCINSIGHNVSEKQSKCQNCGVRLDWKYLKK